MTHHGARVLAIDGGGVFGAIPAEVLAGIEEITRQPIASTFDLVVGTSVGGLIALMLACPGDGQPRHSARAVADLFPRHAPRMFDRRPLRRASCRALALGPLYRAESLEAVLHEHLGDAPMPSAAVRASIPAFDMVSGRLAILATDAAGPLDHALPRMRDAARAATAAPTYFDPVIVRAGLGGQPLACLIDAGVCVNNPALLAVQEAARLRLQGPVSVLSLGCGARRPRIDPDRLARWPRVRWVCPLLSLLTEASAPVVDGHMRALADHGLARYLRLEADLAACPGVPEAFDDTRRAGLRAALAAGRALLESHRAAVEAFLAG